MLDVLALDPPGRDRPLSSTALSEITKTAEEEREEGKEEETG